MKLSSFIRANTEPIIHSWEQFATELSSGHNLDTETLRDHATGILLAIASALERPQTAHEQAEKSKGRGPRNPGLSEAMRHGALRAAAGFSLREELSEFRALRASVLQLWAVATSTDGENDEIVRFNEAICQAQAESVEHYSAVREQYLRLFDTLLSSSCDLNFIVDAKGSFIYANRAFAGLYNMALSQILRENFFELNKVNPCKLLDHLHEVVAKGETIHGELPYPEGGGKIAIFEFRLVPVLDAKKRVEAVAGIARDITQRKVWEQQIERMASYDALTGLPNRYLFFDRLEREIKRARRIGLPLALLFIDLDGFKEVNDQLGHDAGDRLLREAAQRISSCVRDVDTVARLGGDEFTVVLTEIKRTTHIEIVAQQILDDLRRPFFVSDKEASISASIGITIFPQDAKSGNELVRSADQAMYVAKNAGRNRVSFFTKDMRDAAWMRLKVIDELRHALPGNQLIVYYQPIIDLSNQKIVKAEAFLKWQHPTSGMLNSAEFVGLAEEAGLIGDIDSWVFDEALACAGEWSITCGAPFQISVNRSSIEFTSKTPTGDVEGALARSGLPRDAIAVEIEEGVLLNNSTNVQDELEKLQHAGVKLAIHRFGTGYASMSSLQKFHIDCIKLDASFVHAMPAETDRRVFVEATIEMAHRFGIAFIAEGVETAEQRNWLRAVGCDYGQGWFFSAPVADKAFGQLLRRPTATRCREK